MQSSTSVDKEPLMPQPVAYGHHVEGQAPAYQPQQQQYYQPPQPYQQQQAYQPYQQQPHQMGYHQQQQPQQQAYYQPQPNAFYSSYQPQVAGVAPVQTRRMQAIMALLFLLILGCAVLSLTTNLWMRYSGTLGSMFIDVQVGVYRACLSISGSTYLDNCRSVCDVYPKECGKFKAMRGLLITAAVVGLLGFLSELVLGRKPSLSSSAPVRWFATFASLVATAMLVAAISLSIALQISLISHDDAYTSHNLYVAFYICSMAATGAAAALVLSIKRAKNMAEAYGGNVVVVSSANVAVVAAPQYVQMRG